MRLLRPIWPLVAASSAVGAVSGLATAAVLAKVNEAIHAAGELPPSFLLAFVSLVFIGVAGALASGIGSTFASGRINAALNKDLADLILTAPIERLEQLGRHRAIAALNADAGTLSMAINMLSGLIINLGVTAGCFAYMVYLSPSLFAIAALGFAIGSYGENVLRKRAVVHYGTRRTLAEILQKHYQTLTEGCRELRINKARRLRVRDESLGPCIEDLRRNRLKTDTLFELSHLIKKLALFVTIGAILAYKVTVGVDNAVLSGFVLVLLYVEMPVTHIIAGLPEFGRAQIAYGHIAAFSAETSLDEPDLLEPAAAPMDTGIAAITLRGVSHTFPSADGRPAFTLGPIDLTIRRGEILFIVGENGSGKTTLIKLILGLYPPQAGTVLLDGVPVIPETRDAYRQHFSAVFFDYTLFDDLVLPAGTGPEAGDAYLEKLDLAHKVTIRDGAFSTTDLSAGQRKRLALIQAYLEGRPVLVLDEWAAEQDPTFRRLFYADLLPALKREGRTLVVVSHDDRYFGAADRVVHLDDGRMTEAPRGAPVPAETSYFGSA
ncbi:cyclic peptide export ABC transporter [Methylobacterium sp. J-090]|uniref:cyclic peptide export ABC transporter n=1 Tax=Methylobacterium sp. J-090 TaxID=2836666 RepID=UPI001FBB100B|nr:cyclic peptide export ABC transporter [Methylobacterium sp. J-090]MCJ2079954.1 cyclic peptide export ABC transporter [Methylobacterium sp. J-090]